jgi:OOP family OmpA-OmpF porin
VKKILLATALIAGMASQAAMADSAFYVGGSVGQTEIDYAAFPGLTVTDDSDTSWKLFAGYNFNKNVALEFAYQDLGDSTVDLSGVPVSVDGDAVSLAVLGKLPLGEKAEVFAKLGVARLDANVDAAGIGSVSDSESDVLYGLGFNYNVTDTVDVRLEWERMDFEDQIDTVSLGVSYHF